jgi:hypothetical protein
MNMVGGKQAFLGREALKEPSYLPLKSAVLGIERGQSRLRHARAASYRSRRKPEMIALRVSS